VPFSGLEANMKSSAISINSNINTGSLISKVTWFSLLLTFFSKSLNLWNLKHSKIKRPWH